MSISESRPDTSWGPQPLLARISPPSTQADKVTKMILEDILSDSLRPGERLKPETLSARYSTGLTPVREALLRLSAEGFVQGGRYNGFEVPGVNLDELMDIANIRAELSCLALRESIRQGDDKWEVSIIAAYHSIERIPPHVRQNRDEFAVAWEERNWIFHDALEAACASPWLKHFIATLAVHSRRYRRRFFDYEASHQAAQEEHKAIMEAALNRDADTACKLMTDHVLERVRLFKRLAQGRDSAKT